MYVRDGIHMDLYYKFMCYCFYRKLEPITLSNKDTLPITHAILLEVLQSILLKVYFNRINKEDLCLKEPQLQNIQKKN